MKKILKEQSFNLKDGKIKIGKNLYKLQIEKPLIGGWSDVNVDSLIPTSDGWEIRANVSGIGSTKKIPNDSIKKIISAIENGDTKISLGGIPKKQLIVVNEENMKNFDNEFDFEDDEISDDEEELDYPEGYLDYEDQEDELQNKMKLKSLQKNLSVSPSGRYNDSWKEKKPYSPIKSDDLPLDKYLEKKKKIKIKESDILKIVKKVISEQENERYMFFQNLEQIKRQAEILLSFNPEEIEGILDGGHDWAQDHIATAKESFDQVFDFLMNETKRNKGDF